MRRSAWFRIALFGAAACSVPPRGAPYAGGDSAAGEEDEDGGITGTVAGADGEPVEGAHVVTEPLGYEAETDGDGAFSIDPIPPGDYTLWVAAEGFATTTAEASVAAGDEASVAVVLEADGGATLTVTVTGPDGEPLEGATVTAGEASAATDADGVAALSGLPAGTTELLIEADGLWPTAVPDLEVPEVGGLQVARALAGRAGDDAAEVGSSTCAACHTAAIGFDETPHARALTEGTPDEIAGQGVVLVDLGSGASAAVDTDADPVTVAITDATGATVTWEVAGWIGDPAGGSVPYTDDGTDAWPLPVAWVAADPDRPDWTPARWEAWTGVGWLDESGALSPPGVEDSAQARCFGCHATGYTVSLRADGGVALEATRGSGRWSEAGVTCEACHGPGSDHVVASNADKPFVITNPALLEPDRADEVCGRCHARTLDDLGLPYPLHEDGSTMRPGEALADLADDDADLWPSGVAARPGEQLDEFRLSVHGSDPRFLRCLDCHDPHGSAGESSLLRLPPEDNTACTACHEDLAEDDALADHTGGHLVDPDGELQSGRCVHCHMPDTAGRFAFDARTGAGDRASHLFEARPPQDTVDAFDAAGATTLPVGAFPIHGCSACHAWYADTTGATFITTGDPTERQTHVDFQSAYEERF